MMTEAAILAGSLFAVDPAWLAHYNQAAAQTSRIVAQTNALSSNTIAQNGRMQDEIANRTVQTGSNEDQISNMIVQGGAARSAQTMAAEGSYDQNAVRGTGTFSNPDTNTTFYNVDLTQPYHFVDNSGVVHNTSSSTPPPDVNWHPLQQLPPEN